MTFYSIRLDGSFLKQENQDFAPIQLTLALDENIKQTIRETYTIADALSSTGGFLEIIHLIAIILIGGIQQKLYYFSIIKDLLICEESTNEKNKTIGPHIGSLKSYADPKFLIVDLNLGCSNKGSKKLIVNLKLLISLNQNQEESNDLIEDEQIKSWPKIKELQRNTIDKYLRKLIQHSQESQIDRRILKNLMQVEDQALSSTFQNINEQNSFKEFASFNSPKQFDEDKSEKTAHLNKKDQVKAFYSTQRGINLEINKNQNNPIGYLSRHQNQTRNSQRQTSDQVQNQNLSLIHINQNEDDLILQELDNEEVRYD
ncbi:UNKNOWN [Stylonychia lemnae]|uniref:Uncharacterized protein n=1 Tax=Stylonychia lemnae TaxID=5949 RepID=A0A078AB77_STYLE|nr:UNKNOWN [Stylonychia lemnae]|eukprot:CDW78033.1 UNKNOWN [Stylonychia lemnae]